MRRRDAGLGDERGVVAVIVALCLVMLMGALALSIDVGGLLLRRREMVNGADSAALAAAMACSKGQGLASATTAANHEFTLNSPGAAANGYQLSSIVVSPTCGGGAGHVTVTYRSPQKMYFAPVFGADNSSDVTTAATASWGPGGLTPVVLNIGPSQSGVNSCAVGPTTYPAVGQDCYYLYNNTTAAPGQTGTMGALDLTAWNVASSGPCNGNNKKNMPGEVDGTIVDAFVWHLNYPNPTWVCQLDGTNMFSNGSNNVADAFTRISGQMRYLPLVCPYSGSFACVPSNAKTWNVIGIGKFLIPPNPVDTHARGTCGTLTVPKQGNWTCLHLVWEGGGIADAATLQLDTVTLCDLKYGTDPTKGTCLG